MLHWKLCEKCGFKKAEKLYIEQPEKVLEFEDCKILWDFHIQTDKKRKKCLLIYHACPRDSRIERKEGEKLTNYSELKCEIGRIWKIREVEVISVVIRALRTVTKHFEK